ncbi:2Fe-2S iron-sulfur cluster-binding protein [uncultured Cohaesibacter sp.]|uniref:2Fe-2S iron-sulfur cluster-binding protein n=1 Tax=uncultured Cohaesibacter sp. TaxID=1002546 RepID=UPI0029C92B61|nr:2Fe-2S iron-sulfur cluster-binding protein [uncultured Cohaesibacter sp.]
MTNSILWDGVAVPFKPGESISDALRRHGLLSAAPIFCGIGQCQNCLVLIEGRGVREACLSKCEPDLKVSALKGKAAEALRQSASKGDHHGL